MENYSALYFSVYISLTKNLFTINDGRNKLLKKFSDGVSPHTMVELTATKIVVRKFVKYLSSFLKMNLTAAVKI